MRRSVKFILIKISTIIWWLMCRSWQMKGPRNITKRERLKVLLNLCNSIVYDLWEKERAGLLEDINELEQE